MFFFPPFPFFLILILLDRILAVKAVSRSSATVGSSDFLRGLREANSTSL